MLHKLPNGDWIEAADVRRIMPRDADGDLPPMVTVIVDEMHITLRFDGYSDAQSYADSLAAIVNAAKTQAGSNSTINRSRQPQSEADDAASY